MCCQGNQLLRRLTLAIPEAVVHNRALSAFSEGVKDTHPKLLALWECQVVDWENGVSDLCPYDLPDESTCHLYLPSIAFSLSEVTLASVKKQLSDEEHQKAAHGEIDFNNLKTTAGDFVIKGLDLEEQQ